jgi:hypothetical protein
MVPYLREIIQMLLNVDAGLFVGDLEAEIFSFKSSNTFILYLSRKAHYTVMGWNLKSSYPGHPDYLKHRGGTKMTVNYVNGPKHLFEPGGNSLVEECLDFIENGLKQGQVYILCDTGKGLSLIMALLYVLKSLNFIYIPI